MNYELENTLKLELHTGPATRNISTFLCFLALSGMRLDIKICEFIFPQTLTLNMGSCYIINNINKKRSNTC